MKSIRAKWRRTSMRTKLVTVMLGLMIIAIFATALSSSHTLKISMTNQIDDQLVAHDGLRVEQGLREFPE